METHSNKIDNIYQTKQNYKTFFDHGVGSNILLLLLALKSLLIIIIMYDCYDDFKKVCDLWYTTYTSFVHIKWYTTQEMTI